MSKRYEYKMIEIPGQDNDRLDSLEWNIPEIESKLNEFGDEGWEVIQLLGHYPIWVAMAKRAVD